MTMTNTDLTKAQLLEKMAELEGKLAEQEAAMSQEIDGQAGIRHRAAAEAYCPEGGGYWWEVQPILKGPAKETLTHLQTKKVRTVDESEAKRWYCQNSEQKPGSNKPLDPMSAGLTFKIKCLDPERAQVVSDLKRLGAVRSKLANNQQLTEADERLIDKYRDVLEAQGY